MREKVEEEPLLPFGEWWSMAGGGRVCGQVMPEKETGMSIGFFESVPSCILEDGHKGEHLLVNSKGKFFCWKYEQEYCKENLTDCDCYMDGGSIECCTWGEVTDLQEVVKSFKDRSYLVQPLLYPQEKPQPENQKRNLA